MKRILSVFLAGALLIAPVLNAGAIATKEPRKTQAIKTIDKSKYTFYEDFSSYKTNQKPTTFLSMNEGTDTFLSVVPGVNEMGEETKLLKFDDKAASASIAADVPVKMNGDKVLIETKFKFVKTDDDYMSFGFDVMSGNQIMARVIQWSSGGTFNVYSSAGINTALTPGMPVPDTWYTLEILLDKKAGTFDVQLQSEALVAAKITGAIKFDPKAGVSMLKGSSIYPESSGMTPTKLKIQTTSKRGELYIDYIRMSNTDTLEYKGEKPQPLPLPMGKLPEISALNGINVKFNGEYLFFTYPPYVEDGFIFVPVKTMTGAYGLSVKHDGENCEIEGGIKVDTAKGTISGKGSTKQNAAAYKNGAVYVSAKAFAEIMGDNAEISGNTVVIGKE